MTRLAYISALELARVAFPGGRVTSGAGQEYLRQLDNVFRPNGFRALIEPRPVNGFRVMSLDESQVFNIDSGHLPYVLRSWI